MLSGDFRYFWPETFRELAQLPSSWDSSLNTGIGDPSVGSLWIVSYLNFTAWMGTSLGLSWGITSLLFWILPTFLLSFFSIYFLFQHLFPLSKKFGLIAAILYGSNSYIQMVFLGGQIGVALSYAVLPLVLLGLLKGFERPGIRRGIIAGLLFSLQVLFDPRFALMSFGVGVSYWLLVARKSIKKQTLYGFIVPLLLPVLFHSYWLLPLVLYRFPSLPAGFSSSEGFNFFSFGDFSHSISLLHPNWPENIFGKVYFLRFQFLLFPIIAFSSLLFLDKKEPSKKVIFFAGLAILAIFLSKGSKAPFVGISNLLFLHLPLMTLFRDPTKFYALIALSYAVLIPYSLANFSELYKKHIKKQVKIDPGFIFVLLFFLVWLLIHAPLVTQGHLRLATPIPNEYKRLHAFLASDKDFYRTLWIPQWQRYGFFSNNHPAVGRGEVLKGDLQSQLKSLQKKESEQLLKDLAIKYVIVPFDSEGEIFLRDREYDDSQYREAVTLLREVSWLKEVGRFGKLVVFEVRNPRDHFWSPSPGADIKYQFIAPTEYMVQVNNAGTESVLVFAERYDKNWMSEIITTSENKEIVTEPMVSREYKGLNSFTVPEGTVALRVYYPVQEYVEIGYYIGGATFLVVLWLLGSKKT